MILLHAFAKLLFDALLSLLPLLLPLPVLHLPFLLLLLPLLQPLILPHLLQVLNLLLPLLLLNQMEPQLNDFVLKYLLYQPVLLHQLLILYYPLYLAVV
jgi:hypothetical protein